jgi:lipid-binding SYLF domain-containing protein
MIRYIAAAFVALALTVGAAAGARAQTEQEDLLRDAESALSRLARQPDIKDNLPPLLRRAKAVLIFPQIIKGAFIIGGSGGSGVLLARNANGAWSDPAFYSIGAMSVGLQIGGQASASVIVIMTEKGLNAVLEQQAKIGADVSAALGPVGTGVGASTGFAQGADMYTYQANQGVFLGASLEGSVIARRQDYNTAFYGADANPRDIVVNQRFSNPKADELRQALARY